MEVRIACVLARDKGMTEKRGVTIWLPLGVMDEVCCSAVAPENRSVQFNELFMGQGKMLGVPGVADAVLTIGWVVSSDRICM